MYVVVKSSRDYAGGEGYAGPACEKAGVEPGKIYHFILDADAAAKKLTAVNPVGFKVVRYHKKADEFRLVLALKIIQHGGWPNGLLRDFAEASLTDNAHTASSFGYLMGFYKWEDMVHLPEKKLGILVAETYEYINQRDKAIETIEALLQKHPKDVDLKKYLEGLRKSEQDMQTLRGGDSAEAATAASGD